VQCNREQRGVPHGNGAKGNNLFVLVNEFADNMFESALLTFRRADNLADFGRSSESVKR
jgi:hypothetical protein